MNDTHQDEFTKFTVPSSRTHGVAERALDRREDSLTHRSLAVARPIDPRVVRVITHEDDDRTALVQQGPSGEVERWIYAALERRANKLANALRARGVERGDRVAVVSPQRVETPLVHVATYKLGAIAVPLSVLYGPDALEFRFADSGAEIVLAAEDAIEVVGTAAERVDAVDCVVGIDTAAPTVDGVEGALIEHDAVANAAVIGVDDETRG